MLTSAVEDTAYETTMDHRDVLDLMRLRYWQHRINELLKKNEFKIPIHLGIGYEAAAVGMDRTMQADDVLCLTHRNASYNLARSKSLDAVLGHYRLVTRTAAGGLMGSMNLAMPGTGIAYASSILGNNLAVSAGIGMNRSLTKRSGVVFVLTGDGAIEEGVLWESLIFIRTHRLPIVIVVENNDHSMSSTIAQRRCPVTLSSVCEGVGIAYSRADGAILPAVTSALGDARDRAAAGEPSCVELDIKTFCQHAGPTPGWPTDPMKLSIDNGLLVEESPADPLYHVRAAVGLAEFDRLSNLVMADTGR